MPLVEPPGLLGDQVEDVVNDLKTAVKQVDEGFQRIEGVLGKLRDFLLFVCGICCFRILLYCVFMTTYCSVEAAFLCETKSTICEASLPRSEAFFVFEVEILIAHRDTTDLIPIFWSKILRNRFGLTLMKV